MRKETNSKTCPRLSWIVQRCLKNYPKGPEAVLMEEQLTSIGQMSHNKNNNKNNNNNNNNNTLFHPIFKIKTKKLTMFTVAVNDKGIGYLK